MSNDALDQDGTPRATGSETRGGHLGFVAHEIRNPLSTALWTAELLARMPPSERGGARGEKLSAMCLRSISRVRQLVEDHLLCERLDAGGLPMRTEGAGVEELVSTVVARRPGETAPASVELDPSLGVEVDRSLADQAIEALIAVAGTDNTPVRVTARATEGEIAIHVAGKGPDAASLEDPVKGSPSDPTGRALAVPLVRRIAQALGGALAVEGDGWLLTLPRARAYTPRPSPTASP